MADLRTGTGSGQASGTAPVLGRAVAVGRGLALAAGAVAVAFAAWIAADALRGSSAVPWVLGRATGVATYVLLVALVTTGILLAHPWSRGMRRPTPALRLGVHIGLATFTLVFTLLHVVVLATDPWAQVGWRGAVLPMASQYRPVAVTLGVLALWAGLVTGVTARLAGSIAARVWWPVHKVAALVLALVWAHSVLAGTDVVALRGFYVASGAAVLALAVSRYAARTPTDRVDELAREMDPPEDADLGAFPWDAGAVRRTEAPRPTGARR